MNLLDNLNERQLAAVTLPDQSALILAGAGSGKTRVLTTRIAWLISTGRASAAGILAVTFTNKAAREMTTRLSAMLPINVRAMWIGTFHGLCNRLLRAHWRDANLPSTFQILDNADQMAAIKRVLKAAQADEDKYPPRNVMWFINECKEAGRRAREVEVSDEFDRKMVELYAAYDAQCQRDGVVDFAELLLRSYELLLRNPSLRAHYQARFRHILVDEFQDTNVLQYKWLKLLAGHGEQRAENVIFAVGDDDQCVVAGTLITMADGTTKKIEQLKVGDLVRSGVGGGKIGGAKVTRVFHRTEQTKLVTLHTKSGAALITTPEHIHFAGYAVGFLPAKFFLYLMHKPSVGFRLAVSGHRREHTDGATVPGFRHRARKEAAEKIWIIETFDEEHEAHERLSVMSLKYGLPMRAFTSARNKAGVTTVPREFSELNTERAAGWLLEDRGLSLEHPDDRRRPFFGDAGDVLVNMCSDSRRERPDHRVYARTMSEPAMQRAVAAGFSMKTVTDGLGGWAVQFWRRDYGHALRDGNTLRDILGGRVVQRARLGKTYLPLVPAQYVRPGMAVFDHEGKYETVTLVDHHPAATATVYDIDVEDTHNFAAAGILTHNSIYAFRGANVGNMADFEREFQIRNVIKLEQNYRSHGHILDSANALIRHNAHRLGKDLWTDAGHGEPVRVFEAGSDGLEAAWLVDEVRNLVNEGHARNEVAVLYRSNAQSRVLEHALFNAGIAYRVYGGLRFFERAEIKHALAYLRLLENPNDDTAFLRVVNFPPRGIGARTLESLQDAGRTAGTSLARAVAQITGKGGASLAAFVKLLELMRARTAALPLPDLVTVVLDGSGLAAHYQGEKEGQERLENLNELVNAAIGFLGEQDYPLDTPAATRVAAPDAADGAPLAAGSDSTPNPAVAADSIPVPDAVADPAAASATQISPLAAFLAHASLEAGDNQASQGQDALQLMTIHSAKGLEFDAVFITGLEEGLFPHDNSTSELDGMEEERRLMYVAITRARRRLYMSFAQSRLLHGQTRYGIRSRFLDELPAASLKWLTPRLRQGFAVRTGAWHDSSASNDAALRATAHHGSRYRIGQSVHHAKFGDGVIITLEGSGDDARARINFGPQGVKELALAVAKLQAA